MAWYKTVRELVDPDLVLRAPAWQPYLLGIPAQVTKNRRIDRKLDIDEIRAQSPEKTARINQATHIYDTDGRVKIANIGLQRTKIDADTDRYVSDNSVKRTRLEGEYDIIKKRTPHAVPATRSVTIYDKEGRKVGKVSGPSEYFDKTYDSTIYVLPSNVALPLKGK